MEYRKFDNIIIARIDKGEEILEQLKAIAITENIKLASINALGAINDFTVGVYKTDEKKYYSNSFKGYYEITSLTGTINTMDGEYYAHLHLSAGDEKGEVFGGHLNRAVVSATCELVITVIDGKLIEFMMKKQDLMYSISEHFLVFHNSIYNCCYFYLWSILFCTQ